MLSLAVVGTSLAFVVAVLLVTLSGAAGAEIAGIADPGEFTRYGVTVTRVLAEIAAVVSIGSLLLAAFLVPPQKSGTLAADGYAAISTASRSALCWVVTSIAAALFAAAEGAGRPVTDLVDPQVFVQFVGAIEQPKAWLITAFIAFVLAIACRTVLSWGWTAALFFLAVGGLIPVGATGHSASGGSHDLATNSLLIHLVAAALWVGGLIALIALGRRNGPDLPLAARRFSRIALTCWIAMAVSGVVNALVRVAPADLLTTQYGLLVLAKLTALGMLGVFGQQQRGRGVRALTERGTKGAFLQLAGVEVLIMFVTLGIAGALARTEPPADIGFVPNTVELLIGYQLDGPPTLVRLLFDWRFDLIFGLLAVALAAVYLAGVLRLRRRGDAWPVGRTIAWLLGCATILLSTSSGIGKYAPAMFSVHMGNHMLLSMVAPVFLVLGGAVTLVLRALSPAGRNGPPGPREWVLAFVHSPLSRGLTQPLVAGGLFVGSFYLLYFSGLFDVALDYHWAHLAMNAHFLIVGYVFFWPLIGVDPAPRPMQPLGRLALMFASMPFHAFFGVILMNSQTVIGAAFYRGLDLPWVDDLLSEQRLGGGIAWASGEIPALIVLIALMVQWARADERQARRIDRKADADSEADLTAYNEMLRRMANESDHTRR
ncbi:MAG: copper resistance protein CopD [Actinophytocola sp.]|nr:copper resistance protein CopD [Actinophytocola sp.]